MKKIIYLIILILLIIGVFGGYVYSKILLKDIVGGRAETMSAKFVANLYNDYTIIGKNCQGEDTNADGYVSCDVRIRKGEDLTTERTLNLQCPTLWKSYTGSTCKESRLAIPGQE
jgi:flagellar basal body-associated protein FliL